MQVLVELFLDDARFDPCPTFLGVYFQNAIQVLRVVDDDGVTDRLASETGPSAPRQDGDAEFGGDLGSRQYIFKISGDDYADRVYFVDACVSAVEEARCRIETHLADNSFLQPAR